jgi:hypothetical protein
MPGTLHEDPRLFHIANSDIRSLTTQRKHDCAAKTMLSILITLLTATHVGLCQQHKKKALLQQWLRERATMLRYTYIAYVVHISYFSTNCF